MTTEFSITDTLSVSDHLASTLIPGNQAWDWKQRWTQIQDELMFILRPHTDGLSITSIHGARQRLFSFFITVYHLKDALKGAADRLGIIPSDVEDTVTNDARLALLADLANLDKHIKLSRPPRSGTVPVIGEISGSDDQEGSDWQISVQIKHGARILDGLAIAEDAVNAWREKLRAWRLI